MRLSLVILLLTVLSGCRSASPPPSVDVDRLADAYVSVLLLKAKLGGADTSLTSTEFERRMTDSLRLRGFTREEFQRQFESLSDSPDDIRKFNRRVQEQMPSR